MPAPWRSASSIDMAAMSTGKVITTIRQVTSIVQQKTGMRSMVMPGRAQSQDRARASTPRRAGRAAVARITPSRNMSMPVPGVLTASESGT